MSRAGPSEHNVRTHWVRITKKREFSIFSESVSGYKESVSSTPHVVQIDQGDLLVISAFRVN